ncbi:phospholipase C [Anopheles sinensis]|uniref:Phospholipase C n=1 Tax=Anopheles sinensis TaxID=74873 RepID=A0A084VCU4_ANOSI|nr:phospholipase C [Anopheles sinensis]
MLDSPLHHHAPLPVPVLRTDNSVVLVVVLIVLVCIDGRTTTWLLNGAGGKNCHHQHTTSDMCSVPDAARNVCSTHRPMCGDAFLCLFLYRRPSKRDQRLQLVSSTPVLV